MSALSNNIPGVRYRAGVDVWRVAGGRVVGVSGDSYGWFWPCSGTVPDTVHALSLPLPCPCLALKARLYMHSSTLGTCAPLGSTLAPSTLGTPLAPPGTPRYPAPVYPACTVPCGVAVGLTLGCTRGHLRPACQLAR